jgi:XTP/dITP diphosphohydrolase
MITLMNKVLLLATRNQDKKKEIQQILQDLSIKIVSLEDIKELPEVIEDGTTFAENAIKKASQTAALSGYICLADDSGLEVDALDGQPGIYSARFSGEEANDKKNNEKLLTMLKGVKPENRTARFVCSVAISDPAGNYKVVTGKCEGRIEMEPRGTGGFGYDPLFIPQGESRSFAELSPEEKNSISHRAKALRMARSMIEEFF